jgi:lipopolysaccharide transport system permease protein
VIGAIQPARRQSTLGRYVDLIITLAARSLKVRYRGSFLGVYWSLSNPVLMTGVYSIIFGTAFASYYDHSIANYMLAVFTGLAVLSFFSAATSQALTSVVGNGGLLNKIQLPYSVFPLSYIAANVFQLAVGTFPVLALVTMIRAHSAFKFLLLLAPLTGLILVVTGFALALSALFVFFRDLPYLYELVMFVMMMTTPIFYPAALVPEGVRPYLALNPLATIVESVRSIALSNGMPTFGQLLLPLGTGVVSLLVGGAIFALLRNEFMDLL